MPLYKTLLAASLLAAAAVDAQPTGSPMGLEARTSRRNECRQRIQAKRLHRFCRADLAFYKAHKCAFPNVLPTHFVPSSLQQYGSLTVLAACAEVLGVPVPTCAPLPPTLPPGSTDCLSSKYVLPSDPSLLGICRGCSCAYIKRGIQCTYSAQGPQPDSFSLPATVDLPTVLVFTAYGGRGGGVDGNSGVDGDEEGLSTPASACAAGSGGCSVYVGAPGTNAGIAAAAAAVRGGGGGAQAGGAGGGGATYMVRGPTSLAPSASNLIVVAGGGGGSAQIDSGGVQDQQTRRQASGSFLQGGAGRGGGGGGGGGYQGGEGGVGADSDGQSGSSFTVPFTPGYSLETEDARPGDGAGAVYISFGCPSSQR